MSILAARFRMPPSRVLFAGPDDRTGWEVLRVERGEAEFYFKEGRIDIQTGSILVIPPTVEYHIFPADNYVDISIELSEAVVLGVATVIKLDDDLHGTAGKMIGILRNCCVDRSARDTVFAASIQRAFQDLLNGWLQRRPSPELIRLRDLMRENVPNADFRIAEAIDSIPQSRGYTRLQFKQAYGCTPTAYLNHLRVEVAKLYLASSNYSISEIAYRCGFRDAKYFTRVFRRETSITPTQYLLSNAREDSEPPK